MIDGIINNVFPPEILNTCLTGALKKAGFFHPSHFMPQKDEFLYSKEINSYLAHASTKDFGNLARPFSIIFSCFALIISAVAIMVSSVAVTSFFVKLKLAENRVLFNFRSKAKSAGIGNYCPRMPFAISTINFFFGHWLMSFQVSLFKSKILAYKLVEVNNNS
jgi:hypothetical protein